MTFNNLQTFNFLFNWKHTYSGFICFAICKRNCKARLSTLHSTNIDNNGFVTAVLYIYKHPYNNVISDYDLRRWITTIWLLHYYIRFWVNILNYWHFILILKRCLVFICTLQYHSFGMIQISLILLFFIAINHWYIITSLQSNHNLYKCW